METATLWVAKATNAALSYRPVASISERFRAGSSHPLSFKKDPYIGEVRGLSAKCAFENIYAKRVYALFFLQISNREL